MELEKLARVGHLVNAMERLNAAAKKIRVNGAVGCEHEFFDEAVSDVALAARDVGHALLFVEFNDRLREIEVDGAVLVAAGVEEQSELLHVAETRRERGVKPGHFLIAFEDFCDVRVGHALGRTKY